MIGVLSDVGDDVVVASHQAGAGSGTVVQPLYLACKEAASKLKRDHHDAIGSRANTIGDGKNACATH